MLLLLSLSVGCSIFFRAQDLLVLSASKLRALGAEFAHYYLFPLTNYGIRDSTQRIAIQYDDSDLKARLTQSEQRGLKSSLRERSLKTDERQKTRKKPLSASYDSNRQMKLELTHSKLQQRKETEPQHDSFVSYHYKLYRRLLIEQHS